MSFHPSMPTSLRRAAAWPAWPRRIGVTASPGRPSRDTVVQFDWPLLVFWVCYFALVAAGVWLFLR